MVINPAVWSLLFVLGVAVYLGFVLWKTRESILVLPLFFPLYLWKVEFKGIPLTFVEALIYSALLAFTLKYLFEYLSRKEAGFFARLRQAMSRFTKTLSGSDSNWSLFAVLAVFVLAAIYSALISPDKIMMWDGVTPFYGKRIALGILKGWIVAPVIMFMLLYFAIKKGSDILKMLDWFSISAFVLSLYALYQVMSGQYLTPDARASGPFESANYLALYISPAVVYLLIRLKESVVERSKSIYIFTAGFLVTFAALIFSKSYTAIVAIFISLAVYFLIGYAPAISALFRGKFKKGFPWKWLFAGLAGVVLVMAIVYFIDPLKWQKMFDFAGRNSSSVRVQVYTIACHLLSTNWLGGIGLGQFPVQYQLESLNVLGKEPYELNMLHPHNFYLALWLNLGLAGFISMMAVIYLCIKKSCLACAKVVKMKELDLQKIRIIGLTLLVIILAHGMFDTPFFKNDLAMIFWMIVAVILAPADERYSIA